jgi:hypothetical protein
MAYDYMLFGPMNKALQALKTAHPNFCDVEDLSQPAGGPAVKTEEGRIPKYIRIGKQKVADVTVLITGGVHAREWAPPDALYGLAKLILDSYDPQPARDIKIQQATGAGFPVKAADVAAIVEKLAIYIIPVVNPDGREYSLTTPGGLPAAPPLPATTDWRKNLRPIQKPDPGKGVDINRNFNILWDYKKHYDPKVSALDDEAVRKAKAAQQIITRKMVCSTSAIDITFIGTGAESEVETQLVRKLMDLVKPRFVFDVHSYGPDIVYPWGIGLDQNDRQDMTFSDDSWNPVRDGPDGVNYKEYIDLDVMKQHICLGNRMKDAVQKATAAKYPVQASIAMAGGYCTTGALDDYSFSRGGPTLAYTIECGSDTEGEFHPTYTAAPKGGQFVKIEAEVQAALLGALVEIAARGPDAGKPPDCARLTVNSIDAPKTPKPKAGGAGGAGGGGAGGGGRPSTTGTAPGEKPECCVEAAGHCSRFLVRDRDGLREQLLFAGSQPGAPTSPVGRGRVLAYETITNQGPGAVRVYWDGSAPGQSTLLLPGNSITIAAGASVKVVYSPDPVGLGDYAEGHDAISWCCPEPWQAG